MARADACLERARSALDVEAPHFDEHTKLRLFLEAQSCLAEIVRRRAAQTAERDRNRNEKIAKRDFWMEGAVIALIGLEIFLSVIFGIVGIREASQQAFVLKHMESSAADTASAMQAARDSLKSLADAQATSLRILQGEQAERAKKPRLALYVGHVPLAQAHVTFKPREETDTWATFDLVLKNVGEATASRVTWRVLVPPDISVTSSPEPTPANDLPDRPVHALLYPLDFMSSGNYTEVSITFSFPKGHQPFHAAFNWSSPEMAGETSLGVLSVTPRTPSK